MALAATECCGLLNLFEAGAGAGLPLYGIPGACRRREGVNCAEKGQQQQLQYVSNAVQPRSGPVTHFALPSPPRPLPLPSPSQQQVRGDRQCTYAAPPCVSASPSAHVTSQGPAEYANVNRNNQGEHGGCVTGSNSVQALDYYSGNRRDSQGAPVVVSSAWTASDGINESELLLEALQGFLILINKKGKVLYVSTNVEEYLGIAQSWLLGRPVLDCIHPEDVKELARQFDLPASKPAVFPQPAERESAYSCGYTFSTERDFFLRMRHYPNGAGSRKKPGNYLVVQWTGQVRVCAGGGSHVRGGRPRVRGLVCVCRPVQSHSILHVRLGGNMFISRHDMRLTYIYCDPRVLFLIGYDPASLLGRTAYHFHNPVDASKCYDCHTDLIKTGTGVSKYYRFLGSTGVWVWMQTKATIVSDTRGKPQYIVCNNYIISQKEGDRCHMMELQQQQQQQKALPTTDLTAKGAIDLVTLPLVTSPTSICSIDDDHDDVSYAHDDTGYNTAISSISSDCTSPGGVGGGAGDLDTVLSPLDFRNTSDFHAESMYQENSSTMYGGSPGGNMYDVTPSLGTGPQDIPVSLPTSLASLTDSSMVSDPTLVSRACGSDLAANLSSEESDPFLGSSTSGSGGSPASAEDMELLEDLLERIADCDKPVTTPSAGIEMPQNDGEEETLFGSSLSGPKECTDDGEGESLISLLPGRQQGDKAPLLNSQQSDTQSQKPASLLRTLLDREGQNIVERPPAPAVAAKSNTPSPVSSQGVAGDGVNQFSSSVSSTQISGGHSGSKWATKRIAHNGDKWGKSVDQLQLYSSQKMSPQSVSDTSSVSQESEDEMNCLPTDLPDDLIDFAMQYCNTLGDCIPETMSGLETDTWPSTVDDLMGSDSQMSDGPAATVKSFASMHTSSAAKKVPNGQVSRKMMAMKTQFATQQLTPSPSSAQSPSTRSASPKDCTSTSNGVVVQPVAKQQGVASMLKLQTPTSVPSPVSSRVASPAAGVLSPVLTDHRYSSARTLSPHSKSDSPAGKRMCMESDRLHHGRDRVVVVRSPHSTQSKSPPQDSVRTSPRPGSTFTGKVIIASPGRHSPITTNKTTVVVGQKLSPQPASPTPVPVPANGGGKPLTAMSELEKHLRGLAPPALECRKDVEDTLTPVGECGDTGSSRPFLERLLTGEISHERYRQIDYHLLYQERERRLSETCSGQSS